MLQFGSKHVCIEDVHIFKHCHEMTLFLLWIGTYCISCVVQQTSGVKDLSSLVRYDDSSLAATRHVQNIIPILRPCPNIRSHSVLLIDMELDGKADGGLDTLRDVTTGLEAQLKKLTFGGVNEGYLSIEYYATDLPDKNPTNVEDLVKLIQEFPSRLKTINNGLGVSIKVYFYCVLKEWSI